jgi:hypothetical protein
MFLNVSLMWIIQLLDISHFFLRPAQDAVQSFICLYQSHGPGIRRPGAVSIKESILFCLYVQLQTKP